MANRKQSLRTAILKRVILVTFIASMATRVYAEEEIFDDSQIHNFELRANITAKIDAFRKNPSDLPAMEILLRTFPEAIQTIGAPIFYHFKDPLKTEAFKTIQGWNSIHVLIAATSGSDLMSTWACRKIVSQFWNSDSPGIKAIGGIIDKNAKAQLRDPVIQVRFQSQGPHHACRCRACSRCHHSSR